LTLPVKEYNICKAISLANLVNLVNDFINQGWQPFGSVAQVEGDHGIREYCQTMVKYAQTN
jgi:hypothetical protein